MTTDTELRCQVCDDEPALGVASSSLGAVSLAYGGRCLAENADARFMLDGTIYAIGPNPADYAEWFWSYKTWVNGKYVGAREYLDLVCAEPGFFDPPSETESGEEVDEPDIPAPAPEPEAYP